MGAQKVDLQESGVNIRNNCYCMHYNLMDACFDKAVVSTLLCAVVYFI